MHVAITSFEVALPRTISRRRITFAGLKKCVPMTDAGREVEEAISSMLSVEVLIERTAPGLHTRSSSLKTSFLRAMPSNTASITKSMVEKSSYEGMARKKEVFKELDRVCKPGADLASNTSTLSIDEIASSTARPEFVIGTHFFSPANVLRLLEVVRGKATSKEVIATCMHLSKMLGNVPVLVGNCTGFVGNRMFGPYRREAQFLVEEGASVEAVDNALREDGMAMGSLATGDLAGLDGGWG